MDMEFIEDKTIQILKEKIKEYYTNNSNKEEIMKTIRELKEILDILNEYELEEE